MAYDEELDARVAEIVLPWGATRKKMFGGTGYMLNGNMMAGVHGERLILRLSDEAGEAALKKHSVKPFDMVPRPMPGWVMVDQEGLSGKNLKGWLDEAHEFVQSLPSK